MAVLSMKRIDALGMKGEQAAVLSELQSLGVMEIAEQKPKDVFVRTNLQDTISQNSSELKLLGEAIDIMSSYSDEAHSLLSSLEGRKPIDADRFSEIERQREAVLQTAKNVVALERELGESRAAALRPAALIRNLSIWDKLDISPKEKGTRRTRVFIGTLPAGYEREALLGVLNEKLPQIIYELELIYSDSIMSAIFVLCHIDDAQAVEAALRSLGFAYPQMEFDHSPKEEIALAEKEAAACEARAEEITAKLKELAKEYPKVKCVYDALLLSSQRTEAQSCLLESDSTFVLSGYILERDAKKTAERLEKKYQLYCEISDATGKSAPVAIANNAFSAPCESVLESYSYPGKGEIDPTSIMSIFYYILFGIMLGDAAYGAIMAICCGIALKKFPNMGESLKKMMQLFFYCGLSTLFWGAVFGSWFGDCVGVIAKTFFNSNFEIKALWFEPVDDPMKMLVFSLALGLVHLSTGLVLNGVQALKRKSWSDFFYDTVFWFGLVYSLVIMLLPSSLFTSLSGMSIAIPKAVITAAEIIAVVCALGIILTAGRESKNWFKRILKGLYGLYNISGWLSDVLSYSRLLALGLASGVIATVINQMGSMGGNGIFGAVLFIIVFLAGHIFNLAINLLGAYVHTNRLQFVEFFGKFYSGGGRKFAPLTKNTKYYTIREEISK